MPLPSQHERTLQMMANFFSLREKGLSLKEIAHMYDLDSSTVYRKLDQIVEDYNASHPTKITRTDLLERPHSPHLTYERAYAPLTPIDLTKFRAEIATTLASLNSLLATINSDIISQEEFAKAYL